MIMMLGGVQIVDIDDNYDDDIVADADNDYDYDAAVVDDVADGVRNIIFCRLTKFFLLVLLLFLLLFLRLF